MPDITLNDMLLWLVTPALGLIALATAAHALLNKRDSKAAFGWIGLCIILPAIGPIVYLMFGINRVQSRAQRDYLSRVSRDSLQTIPDPPGTDFRPLSTIGEKLTHKGLSSCDQLDIYENGEELYPAMIQAIDEAQDRVLLASYIFDNDETGRRVADALAAAQARGVEVKVLIDGMGEWMCRPRIGGELKKRNLEFERFNPITLIPPSLKVNMRNHRKLLIVDGLYAFTGGQNIGDRHLADRVDNPHRVQDIHFGLCGKIVDEMERSFWQDWYYCIGSRQVQKFRGANVNVMDSDIWSRLITDGPNKYLDRLSQLFVGVISAARYRVLIMTPYFLPTFDLIGALVAAHLRGVQVQILLPGHNNIRLAHWGSQNTIRQLLEAGLDLRYQPPPFVHSKLLLVDDCYAMIGSANIDPRSLRLNYELGVELFSEEVNARLSQYFEHRVAAAEPITLEQINSRSLPVRLRDSLAWLFSPYL